MDSRNLAGHLNQRPLPFPVYVVDRALAPEGLDFRGTPQTALVGPGGTVDNVRVGAYMGDRLEEVERFFNVKLPGLPDSDGYSNRL